jgi:hypothetical protein
MQLTTVRTIIYDRGLNPVAPNMVQLLGKHFPELFILGDIPIGMGFIQPYSWRVLAQ